MWNSIVSNKLFNRTGYKCPVDLSFTEDFNLMVRLVYESNKTCLIDEGLYFYNQTNISSITKWPGPKKLKEEAKSYEQIEEWMKRNGIYGKLKREMGWRFLRIKADYVSYNKFNEFRDTYPSSNRYILSVPSKYCHNKQKIMMLMTLLHLEFVPRWINRRAGRC